MNLREAAQQALEAMKEAARALDSSYTSETEEERVLRAAITALTVLRSALTEDAMQKLTDVQQEMEAGCAHCNSPMWCGYRCRSCGKVWEWASGIEGEPNEPTR